MGFSDESHVFWSGSTSHRLLKPFSPLCNDKKHMHTKVKMKEFFIVIPYPTAGGADLTTHTHSDWMDRLRAAVAS